MGQRSQTFIKTHNPVYHLLNELKRSTTPLTAAEQNNLEKWKKALGVEPFTVLAYHHQWLYGITFPALIHQLLDFYKQPVDKYANHPLNMDQFMRDIEIGFRKNEVDKPDITVPIRRFVEFHTFLLGTYRKPWIGTRAKGLEGFRFLNLIDPEMREHFDHGDNNDGIVLVDAVEGKYAFMTFSGHEGADREMFKDYTPVTAETYVQAYYPLEPAKITYRPDPKVTDEEHVKANSKRVKLAAKMFKPFQLLTVDEVVAMFPKQETEMRKANPAK